MSHRPQLVHQYLPDGIPDHRGQQRCADCGLPQQHRLHQLPSTDPDVTANEQRRTGER